MRAVRSIAGVAVVALTAAACSVLDTSAEAEPSSEGETAATTTTAPLPVVAAPAPTTTTLPLGPPRALVTPTGVVVPVRGGGPGAWIVGTPCHGEAVIADGEAIHAVTVLIDPGHGGDDEPGAVGAGGLQEADLNLDVAERLQLALARRGIDSVLTRPADYRMAIIARAELAMAIEPAILMSVHHNGGETVAFDAPGVEVFHQSFSEGSRRLAGIVFEELMAAFEPLDAAWVGGPLHGVSSRLNRDDEDLYGILRRPTGVDTVLTEAMYLSNPSEEALLDDPAVRDLEAEALARAIERFLTSDDPGSGFIDPTTFRGDLGSGGGTGGCEDPPLE